VIKRYTNLLILYYYILLLSPLERYLIVSCIVYIWHAAFTAKNLTVDISIPTQPGSVALMSVFGWIVIYQRIGDTFDCNLPWADYKAGFGSIDSNFWLGLENMHLLTSSQPYRLSTEYVDLSYVAFDSLL